MRLSANAGDCAELLMREVNLNLQRAIVVGGVEVEVGGWGWGGNPSVSLCVL